MGNAITNPLSYENKKKIYNSETFSNLEAAIAHKEWLVNNGPNNKESKYYYYETVEVKHRHKIGPFWDNPTYSYHQELRFNHDSYNRDLHNAEETIQSCKEAIYQEGIRLEQIIASSERQQQESHQEIAQFKSINNSCRSKYSALCNKNSQLNTQLNKQLSILGGNRVE